VSTQLQLKVNNNNNNNNKLKQLSKNTQTPYSMKFRPVAAEFFHADGRTDRQTNVTKMADAFGNFAKAPKGINSA
jgi:hypothetical protein